MPAAPPPRDPYLDWLNIPAGPRPPDHYALLGLQRFETDAGKIREATRVRTKLVRPRCLKFPDLGTRLLNEIVEAEICLLDPARAEPYRSTLAQGSAKPVADILGLSELPGLLPIDAGHSGTPSLQEVTSEASEGTYGLGTVAGDLEDDAEPRGRAGVAEDDACSPGTTRPWQRSAVGVGPPVGIGLGVTSFALASVDGRHHVTPLLLPNGSLTIPVAVALRGSDLVVGDDALSLQAIGRRKVEQGIHWRLGDPGYRLRVGCEDYSAEMLSGVILRILLDTAENKGIEAAEAVISVPRFFDDTQRQAVRQVSRCAALCRAELIEAPVAVALAYAGTLTGPRDAFTVRQVEKAYRDDVILVYDLDETTFEASLIRSRRHGKIEVLASAHTTQVGGRHWTNHFLKWACETFQEQTAIDPREDPKVLQQLRLKAWAAQTRLNTEKRARFALQHGRETVQLEFLRDDFEEATQHLLERTKAVVDRMLSSAKVGLKRIPAVVLAGDASRMPAVRELLESMSPVSLEFWQAPDIAKARGAALHGMLHGSASRVG